MPAAAPIRSPLTSTEASGLPNRRLIALILDFCLVGNGIV
jgi:hypothetical protein